MTGTEQRVRETLEDCFGDRVYAVADGHVWVSGMNAHCRTVARRMASELASVGVPCGLVYDDGAAQFGGVQFNYGTAAE